METNKIQFGQILNIQQREALRKSAKIDLTISIFNDAMGRYLDRCFKNAQNINEVANVMENSLSDLPEVWKFSEKRAEFILKMSEKIRDS